MSIMERMTDRSRKVMALANQEAQRFNHDWIGTEHVLLGMIKEGSGVAAHVLQNLGVSLGTVRSEVEKRMVPGPDMVTMGSLPKTGAVGEILKFAGEHADKLKHTYVGTEHLLLGTLSLHGCLACDILVSLGVNLEETKREVKNLICGITDEDETVPEKNAPNDFWMAFRGNQILAVTNGSMAAMTYVTATFQAPAWEHIRIAPATFQSNGMLQPIEGKSFRVTGKYILCTTDASILAVWKEENDKK